jgi:phosphoribulokinase
MSTRHPIISITGSSGAGTTSVKRIFEQIFRREKVEAAFIEGDAFHRYDRLAMRDKVAAEEKNGNPNFTHFNAAANELAILQEVFENYGRKGIGRTRTYVHDEEEEAVGSISLLWLI